MTGLLQHTASLMVELDTGPDILDITAVLDQVVANGGLPAGSGRLLKDASTWLVRSG